MAALIWGDPEDKIYESGIDRGVLFVDPLLGVAWNGLVSVDRNVSGGEVESYYYDGQKYLDVVLSEDFKASITAFSAPREFAPCEGRLEIAPGLIAENQPRKPFALSYRTGVGNELEGDDYGYKIHLVWNATAAPSGSTYRSRSDSVELGERSWDIETVPVNSTTFKPTAHLEINTTRTNQNVIDAIEVMIYGNANAAPRMPTQAQVFAIFQALG